MRTIATRTATIDVDTAASSKSNSSTEPITHHNGVTTMPTEDGNSESSVAAVNDISLKALLERYLAYLRGKGSARTARDYERLFVRFVYGTPLNARRANELVTKEFVDLLRPVIKESGEKAARTVRSALHAAYNMTKKKENDARLPIGLGEFGILKNPVSDVTKTGEDEPRLRALSEREIYGFTQVLEGGGSTCQNLSLRLLRLDWKLGGQRGLQLARVTLDGVIPQRSVMLRDSKGRRRTPREHELPLTAAAAEEVEWLRQRAMGLGSNFLFASESDCHKHIGSESISRWCTAISKFMILKKVSETPFQFRDIRRTVETTLSRLKVNDKVLQHLLSHGLSGVQHKHYNMHPFYDEKLNALMLWDSYLQSLRDTLSTAAVVSDPSWMSDFESWASAAVRSSQRAKGRSRTRQQEAQFVADV